MFHEVNQLSKSMREALTVEQRRQLNEQLRVLFDSCVQTLLFADQEHVEMYRGMARTLYMLASAFSDGEKE